MLTLSFRVEGSGMAVKITHVDDLDGTEGAETVTFAFRGQAYEIDLNKQNMDKMASALQPFIDASRPPGSSQRSDISSSGRRTATRAPVTAQRDYKSMENIGLEHRGRVTEDEARLVRENLDTANANRTREGQAPIDPKDDKMIRRYGFK